MPIRQPIQDSKGKLLWVPTKFMWADGLTKIDKKLRETLLPFIMRPEVCLVEIKETACLFVVTERFTWS